MMMVLLQCCFRSLSVAFAAASVPAPLPTISLRRIRCIHPTSCKKKKHINSSGDWVVSKHVKSLHCNQLCLYTLQTTVQYTPTVHTPQRTTNSPVPSRSDFALLEDPIKSMQPFRLHIGPVACTCMYQLCCSKRGGTNRGGRKAARAQPGQQRCRGGRWCRRSVCMGWECPALHGRSY